MNIKQYFSRKFKTIITILVIIAMLISIYILYGMNVSKDRELKSTKEDLSTAIRLLYKYQELLDEKEGSSSSLLK